MSSLTVRINLFEAVCALVAAKLPTVEVEDATFEVDSEGFVEVTLVPRQAAAPPRKARVPTLDEVAAQAPAARLPKAGRMQAMPAFDPDDVPPDDEDDAQAPELRASAAPRASGAAVPRHRRPVPLPRALGTFDQE